MHFAKKGQAGLQRIQKAGVHRLGQDQVHKPTEMGGLCAARGYVRIEIVQAGKYT